MVLLNGTIKKNLQKKVEWIFIFIVAATVDATAKTLPLF